MSVIALSWSFKLELRDMAAKAVLHALADHADEELHCWPSIDRIARWAGCNEKTARHALKRLCDLGFVSRESRPGTSDIYTLHPSQNRECLNRQDYQNRDLPKTPEPLPDQGGEGSQNREDTPPKIGTRTITEPSVNRQKNRQVKRKTTLPEDWQATEELLDYARQQDCADPRDTAERFKLHHLSRGTLGANWDLGFKYWCRNEKRFGGGKRTESHNEERIRRAKQVLQI